MTTVVAVCADFRGWRLTPAEGCLVTCEDARQWRRRRSAEKMPAAAAGVNDAICRIHSTSVSSTTGELEIDTGSGNCCSDLMDDLIPSDTRSGCLQCCDMEQPLEDRCATELPKEEDESHPNPPDGATASTASTAHLQYSASYMTKVEYGLKLGYREETIHAILNRFGPDISHDELLKELIERDKCTSVYSRESFAESAALTSSSVCAQAAEVLDEMPLAADGGGGGASRLRAIVIDGSNVAMSHGNKKVFSCRGIGLAVDWFRQRGHREITVFVPQWRKENAKQDSLITDQEILTDLERQKILVFTPSRRVNNKRIICYDDRYVLNLAVQNNGIVVSNDNYRDLISEKPEFKKVVEERLLMYSFVNDRFMPPDDPLGRYGPNIDSFLRKEPLPNSQLSQQCPYAKKCTYGNKCKFYHPERVQRPLVPISLQITNNSQPKITEFQQRGCVSCNEKQPVVQAKSLDQTVSLAKLQSNTIDLSALAISLLTGGKNPVDPKKGGGPERHSYPLPSFAPWSVRHDNLRPVHSDPPGLSHPTKCSGHVALAKKLSDESCFIVKSSAQQVPRLSQAKVESNRMESDNRHLKLCRKASLNAPIIEGHEGHLEMLLAQKVSVSGLSNGTILHSVTKEHSAETAQSDRNNNGVSTLAGHSFVTRIHSAPVINQERLTSEANRTMGSDFAQALSTSRSQHKVPLHRVCTSPLALGHSRAPPSSIAYNISDISSSRNPCFQGYPFIPCNGGSNANSEALYASAEQCYPGAGWIQQQQQPGSGMRNPCVQSSDFPRGRNDALMPSDISSGALLIPPPSQNVSTFHFGRNSSFKFVPTTEPVQFFVPPGTSLPEPPPSSFLPENSNDPRAALFFKLCGLFDSNDVCRVMLEHPNEMDSKSLCGHLLQLDRQRKQQQERSS